MGRDRTGRDNGQDGNGNEGKNQMNESSNANKNT